MDVNVSLKKDVTSEEKETARGGTWGKKMSDRARLYSVLSFPSGHACLNYGSCKGLVTVDAGPDLQVINLMVLPLMIFDRSLPKTFLFVIRTRT
jgi:hypothetical protein